MTRIQGSITRRCDLCDKQIKLYVKDVELQTINSTYFICGDHPDRMDRWPERVRDSVVVIPEESLTIIDNDRTILLQVE